VGLAARVLPAPPRSGAGAAVLIVTACGLFYLLLLACQGGLTR